MTNELPRMIGDLQWSVRCGNVFWTIFGKLSDAPIERLTALREEDLLRMRHVGRRTIREIRATLAEVGLTLAGDRIVPDLRAPAREPQPTIGAADRLRQFARAILAGYLPGPCEVGDVDGGAIQDAAVAAGLLVPVDVTAPCGDACQCANLGLPTTCFRASGLLTGDPT